MTSEQDIQAVIMDSARRKGCIIIKDSLTISEIFILIFEKWII